MSIGVRSLLFGAVMGDAWLVACQVERGDVKMSNPDHVSIFKKHTRRLMITNTQSNESIIGIWTHRIG